MADDEKRILERWWEAYERRMPVGEVPLIWQEFSVFILEKFMSQSRREELRRQFEQLRQDGMFVMQYAMRFSELTRHAVWLVPTDRNWIRRFIDGLTYQLRLLMTRERVLGATFDEVVDIARQMEMVRSQERREREAKRPRGPGDFSGVPSGGKFYRGRSRPYKHVQTDRLVHRGESSSHGSYSSHQSQPSIDALPAQSSSRAPSVQGSFAPGASSSYSGSRPDLVRTTISIGELL
ncbi:uncharacterized protein [Nicotiana tomentosiformis]|uniref:uncharacterized protein n=1 Tax=Nicotiana tomentosiformis TaxID=4098 RepID=UPI00388C9EDF